MKSALFLIMVALMLLFTACSKTEIVKLGEESTEEESTKTTEIHTTNITGKTAVKCVDTDGDDIYTSGKVTVTYDDNSKNDFIDECPVPNEQFMTEYVCDGNNVKPKNIICDKFCIAGICFQ